MPAPPPPSPKHILRSHKDQISSLYVSDDNERLYSGDTAGLVVLTAMRTLRALVSWKAHESSILAVKEWEGVDRYIVSHGRDNKLHVWKKIKDATFNVEALGGSAALPQGIPVPELMYSLDVNALNFCPFSMLGVNYNYNTGRDDELLVAVPNLVESSWADVWSLPSCQRLHAAVGKGKPRLGEFDEEIATEGAAEPGKPTDHIPKTAEMGIIMSLHLHRSPHPSISTATELRILMAFEAGSVGCWAFRPTGGKSHSIEGIGWEKLWSVRFHAESVMAMAVSRNSTIALSVSADHLVGRYDLKNAPSDVEATCTIARTKHPGNASVAIHDSGKVCALGGWDGKIRLYSIKTFKSLGTLDYHKNGVQALTFAHSNAQPKPHASASQTGVTLGPVGEGDNANDDDLDDDPDDDGEFSNSETEGRRRWLVAGGKDGRISIWELMDFSKPKH